MPGLVQSETAAEHDGNDGLVARAVLGFAGASDDLLDLGVLERSPDIAREQSYRERRLTLQDLWTEVIRQSEGVVTGFAHARAHADTVEEAPPLLDADGIRELPFVRLFLRNTVQPYLEELRTGPLLIPIDTFDLLRRAG